ncbi:Arginine metabolism regulation protein II [Fusarium oxysporum f. sp. cubense race 1]|uniref:Arginine metabolism regulation protein II n=1 Tax=Fusarium oxysporum f. sp. cubense (strain race 1) TaxID=1229664 RepID=N4U3S5_FUSC1|nr:Arginine metabolism regulation protein II [Fusarium oxysporum f. sp. cubense race 1]
MQTKTSTKSNCRRASKTKNGPNPRSRSGCVTCKAKHTKCDETRPECLRCIRKGVKCGGYWKEFKWSFKHQPGEVNFEFAAPTSPTSSRRSSTMQPEPSFVATPSAVFDVPLDTPAPALAEELPIEDNISILGDASWTTSSCTESDNDIFARSNSIVEENISDMTVQNVEMTSQALTPTNESQYFEGTPLTVGLITDTSSLLISNWFEQVCTLWSGFDSDFNLNRKLALELCTSSQSVFSSLQSMSAGFLSTRLPHMKQSAMYFLQAATGSVLSEAEEIIQNPAVDNMPAVNQDDTALDTDDPVTGPQTDSSMQLAERYMDNSPHPWTGISPLASQLFAQAIRLCRSFRRNLKLPKETGRDFQRALEEIQEAQRLEEKLLGLEFQNTLCVANTGDYRTPSLHLAQVAEAYKLAALLQLYQTFPDLVALRLPTDSVHANSRHIPWEEWIIPLSLRLVNVLEHIPPNSGTRCIQPLLYITASTGLRYDTTTMLDISTSSFDTGIGSSNFQTDPFSMDMLGTSPPPANLISRMSLDISNARHFITGRLNMLESSLPPKPVMMAKELIKAIWDAYDSEAPGSASVHWVDVMEDNNLRSMFG